MAGQVLVPLSPDVRRHDRSLQRVPRQVVQTSPDHPARTSVMRTIQPTVSPITDLAVGQLVHLELQLLPERLLGSQHLLLYVQLILN